MFVATFFSEGYSFIDLKPIWKTSKSKNNSTTESFVTKVIPYDICDFDQQGYSNEDPSLVPQVSDKCSEYFLKCNMNLMHQLIFEIYYLLSPKALGSRIENYGRVLTDWNFE